MEHVRIDEVKGETHPGGAFTDCRPLSAALATTAFAINCYELAPGEAFSGGLHTHYDQEEVFYVVEGTVTFRTTDAPGGEREEVAVSAGKTIRFAPGEYQQGRNETDEPVVALAIGAPGTGHDWDRIESLADCPDCGRETAHDLDSTDGGFRLTCTECDRERVV